MARSARRSSRCIFDNMALYFECQINKIALLQTVFLAILSTGRVKNKKNILLTLQLHDMRVLTKSK